MDELNRKQIEKLIETSDVFCVLPFKHILLQPSGHSSTCCMNPLRNRDNNNETPQWDKIDFNKDLWQNRWRNLLSTWPLSR